MDAIRPKFNTTEEFYAYHTVTVGETSVYCADERIEYLKTLNEEELKAWADEYIRNNDDVITTIVQK